VAAISFFWWIAGQTAAEETVVVRRRHENTDGDWLFPNVVTESQVEESSLLDVIDNVLNHGVVLHGELVLGVANVDLIYAKLSVLLAALDKVGLFTAPAERAPSKPARRHRRSRRPPRAT
jgi:hypothetical protein